MGIFPKSISDPDMLGGALYMIIMIQNEFRTFANII
jgi:hypothetical protein